MIPREEVVQQALGLPPEDRAFVAAALARSLAPDRPDSPPASAEVGPGAVYGPEFLKELQRRSEAFRAGSPARTAAEVLSDMLRRQADLARP
jgi:hypothetical protein